MASLGAALAAEVCGPDSPSRAADVDIATSTNNGVVLDSFAGTTAQVLPGVTVSNTTFNFSCPVPPPPSMSLAGVCASTRAWTLTNQGTIGPANFGDGVHFSAGGSVINQGAISGGQNGIWIEGGAGGSVDNQAGATIHGSTGAIVISTFANPVSGTVTNAGTITSDGQVIGLGGGGSVTNFATGVIIGHGGSNAVSLVQGTSRTVTNSGYIQSNDSGFATGVAIESGTLTNNIGGQILGAYNGVWANGSGATSITNNGYIEASKAQSGGSAIEVDAGGTIINSGTIKSFTSNSTTTDAGINFSGAGSITNSGTIESTTGGLAIQFNGNKAHTLTLDTGSILGGNVRGGTGADGLVLKGTGTESAAKFLAFETLSMQGTDWTLTGSGVFSTSAEVQSGFLHVNGALTTPTMTVAPGGTLGGAGTIIAATGVTVNGTIAPGNSIGTINITGPYTQAAGSAYRVELNAAGQTDLINVSGTAAINGGTVNVVAAPGAYTIGQHFVVLTASGGVTGQYASVTDNTPFVDFQLGEDANNIFLDTIKNAVQFPDIARTRNQKAVAGVLQGLTAGNPIFDAAVMLDVPHALRAFDLLSGEIHATIRGMLLDESRFPREAIIGRLRQSVGSAASIFAPQLATLNYAAAEGDEAALAYAGGRSRPRRDIDLLKPQAPNPQAPMPAEPVLTAWGQAFGNWGHTAGDGNAGSYDRRIGGFLTGLDQTSADQGGGLWRFGFAGGYHHTSIGIVDRDSSGGVASYHLAAYAGTQQGPFGVRLGAAYSWHDIDASRTIAFPGFSDATQAGYDAHTAQVFGEVGYAMTYRQFAFEPFAALARVAIRTAAFIENGGPAALAGSSGSIDATFSTLGLRAAAALPWLGAPDLMAKGSIGWRHAFGGVTPTAELALVSSGELFGIAGAPIARDAAAIELGLDGRIARDATLGIAYRGQLASNSRDNGVTANFVQRF